MEPENEHYRTKSPQLEQILKNLIFTYLDLYAFLIGPLLGSIVQPVMTSPLHGEDPGFKSLWTHSRFSLFHSGIVFTHTKN